jgi:hypothetical protein
VLLYLLRGRLPWQSLPAKTKKEKYDKIMKVKINTPLDDLCDGFPHEFITYLEYIRNVDFEEEPDYDYLKQMFRDMFEQGDFGPMDFVFDWDEKLAKQKKREMDAGSLKQMLHEQL